MAFHSSYFNLGVFVILIFSGSCSSSPQYYAKTCPKALSIISAAVYGAVANESRMGASLLRLHFHDCFVNGCDASILLDDDEASSFTGEKSAGPNANSLRGFEVIDAIKAKLEAACPAVVSCADILAVAARDSVAALGGPTWAVQLGRRDSTTASFSSANTDLASPLMNLDELISVFSNKGFTEKEMIALSGAHTTGQARCLLFRNRIYNETNIDSTFAKSMQTNCPSSGGGDNLSPLDDGSAVIFDNSYFKNLVDNKGLLHSDQQLFSGGSADSQVTAYSDDPIAFKADFADAMVKMGNMSILTKTAGEIRTNCRKVN